MVGFKSSRRVFRRIFHRTVRFSPVTFNGLSLSSNSYASLGSVAACSPMAPMGLSSFFDICSSRWTRQSRVWRCQRLAFCVCTFPWFYMARASTLVSGALFLLRRRLTIRLTRCWRCRFFLSKFGPFPRVRARPAPERFWFRIYLSWAPPPFSAGTGNSRTNLALSSLRC